MSSVTDVRLILFQWAKAKPKAISMKTGITGERALNKSMMEKQIDVFRARQARRD
jgi:hypothetical protein